MTTLKQHAGEVYRVTIVEHDAEDGTDRRTQYSVRTCGAVLVSSDWRYNPPRADRYGYQGGSWSHGRHAVGRRHANPWRVTEDLGHEAARLVWRIVEAVIDRSDDPDLRVDVTGPGVKATAWRQGCRAGGYRNV